MRTDSFIYEADGGGMKKNMADEFKPSWINVIDKSIMEWYNKFDPRFMCIGRKKNHFGNECHSI